MNPEELALGNELNCLVSIPGLWAYIWGRETTKSFRVIMVFSCKDGCIKIKINKVILTEWEFH